MAVVAVLVAGAVKVWRDRDHTIDVVANFDSTSGLYEGNAVAVLGMTVGKVTSIKSRGSYVEVGMEIDADTPVPADVTAVTVSTSVLTDRHVELTPSTTAAPACKRTRSSTRPGCPSRLDRTLAMSQKLAVSLQGDGEGGGPVADLLSTAAAITDGNGPTSAPRSPPCRRRSRSVTTAVMPPVRPSEDGEQSVGAVAGRRGQRRADPQLRVVGAADQRSVRRPAHRLGTTGAQINAILGEATDILTTRRDDMAQTVTGAQAVTKTLVDYRRQLQEFLNVTPAADGQRVERHRHPTRRGRVHGVLDHVFTHGT